MAGITPKGIEIKRLEEIVEELTNLIKATFGEDSRVDENSVFGLLISVFSRTEYENWELIEQAYQSRTLRGGQGVQLDAIGEIVGTYRLKAIPNTGRVQLTGTDGTVVPRGTRYADDLDRVWVQVDTHEILGLTEVLVTSEQEEPFVSSAGTITKIIDTINGLDSVTNSESTTRGRQEESDADYRQRLLVTAQGAGLGTFDALLFRILELDEVMFTDVVENTTDATDGNGIPAHAFSAVVLGGDDTEIAETIWKHKPAGIGTHGDVSIQVKDVGGNLHWVNFQRPTIQPIYVSIDIATLPDWDASYEATIKQEIVKYATDEFSVGDDIIQSKLYVPIASIPGQSTREIRIGLATDNMGTDDIPIGAFQIGEFAVDRIEVVYV
jgi:uncharacterized phage protein gp47/JayE